MAPYFSFATLRRRKSVWPSVPGGVGLKMTKHWALCKTDGTIHNCPSTSCLSGQPDNPLTPSPITRPRPPTLRHAGCPAKAHKGTATCHPLDVALCCASWTAHMQTGIRIVKPPPLWGFSVLENNWRESSWGLREMAGFHLFLCSTVARSVCEPENQSYCCLG